MEMIRPICIYPMSERLTCTGQTKEGKRYYKREKRYIIVQGYSTLEVVLRDNGIPLYLYPSGEANNLSKAFRKLLGALAGINPYVINGEFNEQVIQPAYRVQLTDYLSNRRVKHV